MNKQKHSISIAALLYGINVLTVAAGFVIIVCWSMSAMKAVAQRQLFHDLADTAIVMSGSIQKMGRDAIIGGRCVYKEHTLRITLVSEDGNVVSDTATSAPLENHLDRKEIASAFASARLGESKGGWDIRKSTVTGDEVAYYAMPVIIEGKVYALRLSSPLQRSVYYTLGTRVRIALSAMAVATAVLFLTYLASVFIVRGINLLRTEATQLMKGNLDCHIPLTAPREVLLLQKDMEKMAHEVKRLEQVRKDFVANVSHELKTPITAIIGFSETLLDDSPSAGGQDAEVRHFLEIINSQGKRLMAIIEDLLTLSRLERDSRRPEMMKGDINELTGMICLPYIDRAKERGMSLSFIPSNAQEHDASGQGGEAKLFCMINERLYEEALGNILDNAIKYCPAGSSIVCRVEAPEYPREVRMYRGEKSAGEGIDLPMCARITVEDNGQGIPEAFRERIFERFFRIDKGRSRDMGGTGLGLSIAAHIVKAHGGTLRAASRKDGKSGAVFVMELPAVL